MCGGCVFAERHKLNRPMNGMAVDRYLETQDSLHRAGASLSAAEQSLFQLFSLARDDDVRKLMVQIAELRKQVNIIGNVTLPRVATGGGF